MNSLLKINNLTKEFDVNKNKLQVIKNLSLNVNEGDFLLILGTSGSGKSTLLRLIGGFEHPTSGEVLINGNMVKEPSTRISMIFQSFDQLFPWKTVLNNVLYPLEINKIGDSKEGRTETAKQYIELVGLSGFENYYPHQLSGGMKQRVAIARSLAQKPSIILMDEPFASLDADTRKILSQELLDIWHKTKVTILFVSHNIIEAISIANKFLVLGTKDGTIFFDNPVKGQIGRLKNPDDEGFSECWRRLNELIRR
jgi:NitT/TauT family transport system ATP-binding protein